MLALPLSLLPPIHFELGEVMPQLFLALASLMLGAKQIFNKHTLYLKLNPTVCTQVNLSVGEELLSLMEFMLQKKTIVWAKCSEENLSKSKTNPQTLNIFSIIGLKQ